ncbi:unnamed protein product [Ascophyllum nodosum]
MTDPPFTNFGRWCGPCKMMSETLEVVGPKMKDEIRIFKIDSDKYPSLMTKFGVNGLPTLILFKEGKELNRIEGVLPPEPLMQQVRYWLDGWEMSNENRREQAPAPSADACKPPPKDACDPPAQDACKPPPRDSCAPPSQQ